MLPDKALSHLICATSSAGSSVHFTLHTQRKRPRYRWQQMAMMGRGHVQNVFHDCCLNYFHAPTYWFQGIYHYQSDNTICDGTPKSQEMPDDRYFTMDFSNSSTSVTDFVRGLHLGFFTSHNLHVLRFLLQQIWKSWKYQGADFAEQLLQCPWTLLRAAENENCSTDPDPTIWQWLNSAHRSSAQ